MTEEPREPMSRLSQEPPRPYRAGRTGGLAPFLYGLAALAVIAFIGWTVIAGIYRSQNCIYIFGHWLSVHRTTIPLFCQ
jgi:hypothetical protein